MNAKWTALIFCFLIMIQLKPHIKLSIDTLTSSAITLRILVWTGVFLVAVIMSGRGPKQFSKGYANPILCTPNATNATHNETSI